MFATYCNSLDIKIHYTVIGYIVDILVETVYKAIKFNQAT